MPENLNFKLPMELLPTSQPPELPKKRRVLLESELPAEKRQALQKTLEQLDGNLFAAWEKKGSKYAKAKEVALRIMRGELIRQPALIQHGLRYPETRRVTLSIANTASSLFKELNPEDHYSDRGFSKDQSLMVSMFDAIDEERESIDAELTDEKSVNRDRALSALSEMLDSPVPNHRLHAEQTLVREIPLLMARLNDELDDNSADTHIANAWQNMLLRASDAERFAQVFDALKQMWEARGEKNWSTLYRKLFDTVLAVRSQPLEANKDLLAAGAIDIAGLDGQAMIREWGLASIKSEERNHGPSRQYMYERNLASLYGLKQESPEAPAVLHKDFGITHFGRYLVGMLKQQYEERKSQDPYGIALLPYSDHNGAFVSYSVELQKIQQELGKGGYRIRIVEAESKHGIGKKLIRLDKKYASGTGGNQIDFAIIGGHGTDSNILFGEGRSPSQQIHMADLSGEGMTRGAAQIFAKDARVVLISCSTGAEGGIAYQMKEEFGWTVIAPPKSVAVRKLTAHFESGRPAFDIEYFDPENKDEIVAKKTYSK